MNIPLSQPDITEGEIDAVVAVLRSSRLSLGPKMEEFEALLAAYIGVPYAIAVSSGTAGLHLCIRALGIGPGDEVILPSFTFIAAANAVRYEGATPVFIDIESASLNLDPALIEDAITPRTRAILVVHTFGCPAEMDAILDIARRHQLLVIEDACEAIGAEYHGQKVGSFGDAAVFAFYPNKQITTGEGGVVVTRHPKLAEEVRALRNHGRYASGNTAEHTILGYNYRLSEISCALGCVQLQRLSSILIQREQAANKYAALLRDCESIALPPMSLEHRLISWFVFVVRVKKQPPRLQRDAIMRYLLDGGIGCGRYFVPIHSQPAYRESQPRQPLPVTEAVGEQAIALPFFNRIGNEEIAFVCDRLRIALDMH